jgi:arabinogalactan endo-1,4-beta-galactosidase
MIKIVLFCSILLFQFSLVAQDTSISLIRGVDISSTPQIEEAGGQFKDSSAIEDVLDIFKKYGANYVRLRLWYTPSDGNCGLTKTLAFAKRIKEKGLKFLLDFHYSDSWADPGQQTKPSAWTLLPYNILEDSVYQYTKDVITALKGQGTIPDMVQIGNEITNGMLWPDGRNSGSTDAWTKFANLVKKGIQGVKDAEDTNQVKIIIHIDKGGDNQTSRWFFDNLLQQGVQFDIIGLSYYPWWHGTFSQLQSNMNDLATRYNKDIIIAETAYPWTTQTVNDGYNNVSFDPTKLPKGYPVNVQGQRDYLTYLKQVIENTTNKKCIGFFYWEPAYISVPPIGSPWENYTLFDFNGNAMNSINALRDQNSDSLPTVNVTIKVNTSTMGDTINNKSVVQIRGQVSGVSSGFLPSGERISWGSDSQIILKNIDGDYWGYTFKMHPADKLEFLIWTGFSLQKGTFRNAGWETPVTPYDSSNSSYRIFTAGLTDTTLDLEYYNTAQSKIDQYWSPFKNDSDSIGVLFRVNVAQLIQEGLFDTTKNGPVVVRGDSTASAGVLSMNSNNIVLKKEAISVGGGTFWSGVAYFPKDKILQGTSFKYKFYIENSSFGGWEPGIGERVFNFPRSDTTLLWHFFNDKISITNIEESIGLQPYEFKLYQNYPNPFNPVTIIKYAEPATGKVTLKVYDILGREVAILINSTMAAGLHETEFDASKLSSGIYYYTLKAGEFQSTKKMVLIK